MQGSSMTDPDSLILRPTMIGGESLTVRFDYPLI
jgi:hypothetical protein